jgi:hypothetical protein
MDEAPIQPVGPAIDPMVGVSAMIGLILGLYDANWALAAGSAASWAFLSNWSTPPPHPATHPMNPVVDLGTILLVWAVTREILEA